VTLIVGIICKEAIVLAADSQTTKGIAKQPGTHKIHEIEFANGCALVAESGSASLSNAVIQLFQNKAIGVTIENELTIAKTAEASIREIRNSLTSLHPTCTDGITWQSFFLEQINYFELMVAYYFECKPCLYKLNPVWCIPIPASSYFMTSGIASDLANYILHEQAEPQMDSELASVIAIKVVEDAIEYVEGCGSPTRAALIRTPYNTAKAPLIEHPFAGLAHLWEDPIVIFPQEKVEDIARIIAGVEKQMRTNQKREIHKSLRAQTDELLKSLCGELSPETLAKLKEMEPNYEAGTE